MEVGLPEADLKLREELHNEERKGQANNFLYLMASQALAMGTMDFKIRNQLLVSVAKQALDIVSGAVDALLPELLEADQATDLRRALNDASRHAAPMIQQVVAAKVEEEVQQVATVNQAIRANLAWRTNVAAPARAWAALHNPASGRPLVDREAAKLQLERELAIATLPRGELDSFDEGVSDVDN